MAENLMKSFYDRKSDVLYISIGEPQAAISREVGDDVLIRVHPETAEVVGFTIFNFTERLSNIREEKSPPVRAQFRILEEASN